jgi:hypothetical protein
VAVIKAAGDRVAEQKLHHARFRIRLRPGVYAVELLGDAMTHRLPAEE